jgi:2-polyprenyl-3-methyl-5-hydroxy-6-metoxy-1,4-benzoquinol methylase
MCATIEGVTTTPSCWVCSGATAPDDALAPLPFVRCRSCDFVFRPDLAETVHDVYEQGDYEDTHSALYATAEDRRGRDSDAQVRLALVREHATSGDLLDVGAAGGNFVAAAAAGGFRARGVEPVPAFARFAREVSGAEVAQGTLEELELPPASLDVVTMWHVLEHIPRPVEELQRVCAALRPGGVLAVEVPNAGGAAARSDGRRWASLEPDVHVNQFAPATLRLALERAGFTVVLTDTIPITPYLPRARRVDPRHVISRMKVAVVGRAPRVHHPSAHELLRAVARVPQS